MTFPSRLAGCQKPNPFLLRFCNRAGQACANQMLLGTCLSSKEHQLCPRHHLAIHKSVLVLQDFPFKDELLLSLHETCERLQLLLELLHCAVAGQGYVVLLGAQLDVYCDFSHCVVQVHAAKKPALSVSCRPGDAPLAVATGVEAQKGRAGPRQQ